MFTFTIRTLVYAKLVLYGLLMVGLIVADTLGHVPHDQAMTNVTAVSSFLITSLGIVNLGTGITKTTDGFAISTLVIVKFGVFAVVMVSIIVSDIVAKITAAQATTDASIIGGSLILALGLSSVMGVRSDSQPQPSQVPPATGDGGPTS